MADSLGAISVLILDMIVLKKGQQEVRLSSWNELIYG